MSHWHNKVIAITGGSQGLGLELARRFAAEQATVIVMARDQSRLQQVAASDPNIEGIPVDVLDDDSVAMAVKKIVDTHQKVDIWVNCVGRSTRSDFLQVQLSEYQAMMEINLYSAVRCTQAILPELQRSSGILINIGSLASKTGWRNMSPYAVSKHALAAFSHQVRLEATNVDCLLVCPGPIRRPDAGSRYAEQAANLSATAAEPGAGVKLKGLCPEKLATKIVAAARRRKKELIVPSYTRLLFAILQLSPSLGDWILGKFAK